MDSSGTRYSEANKLTSKTARLILITLFLLSASLRICLPFCTLGIIVTSLCSYISSPLLVFVIFPFCLYCFVSSCCTVQDSSFIIVTGLGFRRFENPVSISGRNRDLSRFHSIKIGFGAYAAPCTVCNGRIQKIGGERFLVFPM
jgi:hypothetical protein